jgi:hypothetical protein
MDAEWDSARLLLRVLAAVALAGAVLVWLPLAVRRAVFAAGVLFHFLAIFVAATAVPTSLEPPWWNSWLFARVYRDYYSFMYLMNAYHFYSPNPGPPAMIWFRVEYDDGEYRWVKIPYRESFPTRLSFQRRLGMTESINHNDTPSVRTLQMVYAIRTPNEDAQRGIFLQRTPEQMTAAQRVPFRTEYGGVKYGSIELQYRPLTAMAKTLTATYARHVAHAYARPNAEIVNVKVYKVTHNMLDPKDFVKGEDPLDPSLYTVSFVGKFDRDGKLQESDGLLYCRLPIYWEEYRYDQEWQNLPYARDEDANGRVKKDKDGNPLPIRAERTVKGVVRHYVLINYVKAHAGDPVGR